MCPGLSTIRCVLTTSLQAFAERLESVDRNPQALPPWGVYHAADFIHDSGASVMPRTTVHSIKGHRLNSKVIEGLAMYVGALKLYDTLVALQDGPGLPSDVLQHPKEPTIGNARVSYRWFLA